MTFVDKPTIVSSHFVNTVVENTGAYLYRQTTTNKTTGLKLK
jgi:hypothetical protein